MTAASLDIALFTAKLGMAFFIILTLVAYPVFAELKVLAWIQDRKDPNPACSFGFSQPLADLKNSLLKNTSFRLRNSSIHLMWKLQTPLAFIITPVTGWWLALTY